VDRTRLVTPRRLAIISHTPHHEGPDGLVGWGPTVTELDHLATRFDEVVHVAPVHDGPPPASALPYSAANLEVLPVRAAGGDSAGAKLGLAGAVPGWLTAMHRGTSGADVLHVRSPANLSGLALAVLRARRDRRPLWVKYAGNWRPDGPEPWTYRAQRGWLRKGWGTVAVTVNGRTADDGDHVRSFANPSLTEDDLTAGAAAAAAKGSPDPLRLAFVGRLVADKGPAVAVEVARRLRAQGHEVVLDVVGDGPERVDGPGVVVHGWLDGAGVRRVLADAHLLLLPSRTEGWPKVLSEAMAYGAVPVAPDISVIGEVFRETGAGLLAADRSAAAFVDAIDGADVDAARRAGLAVAPRFTFGTYLEAVDDLFADRWGIRLQPVRSKPSSDDSPPSPPSPSS
jgi:glycosyltransferase involved in cell wall biosynthesis